MNIRKNKKPYVSEYVKCPFCKKELPLDTKEIDKRKEQGLYWALSPRLDECHNCPAKVTACPACKRDTWIKDGWHKHSSRQLSCGFQGKKKTIGAANG